MAALVADPFSSRDDRARGSFSFLEKCERRGAGEPQTTRRRLPRLVILN
jgi:hypothetical protein